MEQRYITGVFGVVSLKYYPERVVPSGGAINCDTFTIRAHYVVESFGHPRYLGKGPTMKAALLDLYRHFIDDDINKSLIDLAERELVIE